MTEETPTVLSKGWRRSMRGSLYRKRNGWLGIVIVEDDGFTLILRRKERTLEDCMAVANNVLRDGADDMDHEVGEYIND